MNESNIGEVAADVFRYLEQNGGRADLNTVRAQVKPRNGVSPDLGTGWLAREGKLSFTNDHGSVLVGIRR
jgi:hypothetical protein